MTSAFRTRLIVEADGGLPYTLYMPLVYDSALLNWTITVPVGFRTDLASIPKALWNILPPMGRYTDAAVVHDACYQLGLGLTRGQADSVLNEAMGVLGVGRFTRWTIYSGVRLGGWKVWNTYRAEAKAQPL